MIATTLIAGSSTKIMRRTHKRRDTSLPGMSIAVQEDRPIYSVREKQRRLPPMGLLMRANLHALPSCPGQRDQASVTGPFLVLPRP